MESLQRTRSIEDERSVIVQLTEKEKTERASQTHSWKTN
jgi:DNA-binding MarR family transcriptional regulator